MSEGSASATGSASASASDASPVVDRASAWRRFLDRFIPPGERRDALWIIGSATLLACIRAVAYQPLQRYVASRVFSPLADELGFALRATAIADVAWGVFAGLFILLLFRFTKAPKATALYIMLAGVLIAIVALGNRLSLNAVMALSGSAYVRSLLSDLQPMMLAAAEAVGIALAAWAAQLMSGEERPADGSTFLPAIGWTGTPLVGAAWLAVAYVTARAVGQMATTLVAFAPQAYGIFASVREIPGGIFDNWPGQFATAAGVAIYFLVGYLGVKRFGMPVTIWLALLGAALPAIASALALLPNQYALIAASGGLSVSTVLLGVFAFVAWPLFALPPFFGVWLATRPSRVSEPSATLREDNDHW